MNRQRFFTYVLFLIAAAALVIRVPRLGLRPMHADEAVQAARFRELWQEGRYQYDPQEFHGPTLIFATYPAMLLSRVSSFAEAGAGTFRAVPLLFGAGSVLLLWFLRDALGRAGAVWGAVFLACSPACVFYSRYYIHETLLVCFTLGALACGWRAARSGHWGWYVATGAAVGLMQATKETAVLSYAAAAGALIIAAWSLRRAPREDAEALRTGSWLSVAAGVISGLCVAAVLFSSFGTHLRGPWDGVLTYVPWLQRAGGASPHIHPWYFYLQRLLWWRAGDGRIGSEAFLAALAGVGVVSAAVRRWRLPPDVDRRFVRFLATYTILATAIYALIPYKTPWCLLQFWLGAVLLAGVGAQVLWAAARGWWLRGACCVVLVVGTAHLLAQTYWTSFVLPADPGNPYVYAQTTPDVERLEDQLQQLLQASDQQADTPLQVIWSDYYYWPLPWYVRQFTHVEWWTAVPDKVTAPLVISVPQHDAELTRRLGDTHIMTDYFQLRPQVLAQLWVRQDLWEDHLRRLGRIP